MSSTPDLAIPSPRVFISYAHESTEHEDQVSLLGTLLRELGIDARVDSWDMHERQDWSQWAIEQLDNADFVLAIASPRFRDRADGRAPSDEGRGSQFEGAMLRNLMTRDRATWLKRILPVLLPGMGPDDIPEFLSPYSATYYPVDDLTPDGIMELRRTLLRQPAHPIPPLGTAQPLPPEQPRRPMMSRPGRRDGQSINVNHSDVGTFVAGDYHNYGGPTGGR